MTGQAAIQRGWTFKFFSTALKCFSCSHWRERLFRWLPSLGQEVFSDNTVLKGIFQDRRVSIEASSISVQSVISDRLAAQILDVFFDPLGLNKVSETK